MIDRWNPPKRTIETPKPIKLVMVAASSSSAVVPRGKTWGIRERGDLHKLAPQTYRCQVHGEFVVEVPLSDVPDWASCPSRFDSRCAAASPWAGSSCGIGHAAGEVCS